MTTWTNISGGSAISQSLADEAATSATNAANSASAASTSATAAEAAKTAAQASETASAASETASAASEAAAASSETAAAASETAAAASESAAAASETAAAGSATSASSSATSASTSASGAATSATNAATSASNAATSESNASTSASNASSSATAAAGSATSASNSATAAAADLATFQGQYHASATAPTTGLDVGDLWFDTVAGAMKVYDGSSWVAAYISAAGMLAAANNLSDVSSASASRTNLGLAIGTDVQAYDAGLNDIAGLAVTDGNFVVGDGSNWVAESGATARTSLGLGTMATQAATAVDIDGGTIDGTIIGAASPAAGTFTTAVVSGASSSDLVRITQAGTGNALVVEDSTNPDSTPVIVNASGRVIIGHTTAESTSIVSALQVLSSYDWGSSACLIRYSTDTGASTLRLGKSKAASVGGRGVVQNGDSLGLVRFYGDDGTNFVEGAKIAATVDGTPGTNDMPGRLTFSTTADGASSPTERMRIDSSGNVGIGRTPTTNKLEVAGTIESTTGGFKFPDGSTQSSAGASTGKAIAMAIVFGG